MAATLVQSKSAAQNTGLASVAATWDSAATAGNLLVIAVASDDYRTTGGIPTGFTESTGCKQETFHGHYVWWKVAAGGETSATYTIGSASPSCWLTQEWSGVAGSPYDTSNGQFQQASGDSYTTPAIAPYAGGALLIASMAYSKAGDFTGMSTWLNSFVEVANNDVFTTLGAGTRDSVGAASLSVTGDGSTTYSTGATSAGTGTPTARSGIILSFKESGGPPPSSWTYGYDVRIG